MLLNRINQVVVEADRVVELSPEGSSAHLGELAPVLCEVPGLLLEVFNRVEEE